MARMTGDTVSSPLFSRPLADPVQAGMQGALFLKVFRERVCLNPVRSPGSHELLPLSPLSPSCLHLPASPQIPGSFPGLGPTPPSPPHCPSCSPSTAAALETLETSVWLLGEHEEGAEVKVKFVSVRKGAFTGQWPLHVDHTQATAQRKVSPVQLSKYQA